MRHTLLDLLINARDKTPAGQMMAGATLPIRAFKLLAGRPSLWPMVLVPALINLALFGLSAYFFLTRAGIWLDSLWQKPQAAGALAVVLTALWYVVYTLSLLAGIAIAYVVVLFAGSIIASPFHDILSEKVERLLLGHDQVVTPELSLLGATLRSLASTAIIAIGYAIAMLPVLSLNLIPVAGSLAASILGGLVSAYFLSLEFSDPLLERRSLQMKRKFALIREHFWMAGSFGFATSLCLWVPLINFITMPLAVIGGTALGIALLEDESEDIA